MLFKNFHIDSDWVVIDDQKVKRPTYISPSQWYDFWAFSPEANDSENLQSVIDKEVDALVRAHEMEHEEELEKQARELSNTFDDKIENLLRTARDKFYEIEGLIEDARPVKYE